MTDTAPILLIAALRDELAPALSALGRRTNQAGTTFTCGRHTVLPLITGMGAHRLTAAVARAVDQHHPARLVLVGFSGGLVDPLRPGVAVHATCVIDELDHAIDLTGPVPSLSPADHRRHPATTLLSVKSIVTDPADKRRLGAAHLAAAVDLESFSLASYAAGLRLPLTIIRAISDPVDAALPRDIGSWVKPDGSPSVACALFSLIRRPWLLPTLLRLRRHSKAAARGLASEVVALLR